VVQGSAVEGRFAVRSKGSTSWTASVVLEVGDRHAEERDPSVPETDMAVNVETVASSRA
jgi:hypothetical protein